MRLEERQGERQCPLCRDELSADDVRACAGCSTEIHGSCAEEFGGCPTIGCSASSGFAVERARSLADRVQDKLTDVVLQDIDARAPRPKRLGDALLPAAVIIAFAGLGYLIHDALLSTSVAGRAIEVVIGLYVLASLLVAVGWVTRDRPLT